MATSSSTSSETPLKSLEIRSYIRGYHAYHEVWNPTIGEFLILSTEPTNAKDPNAVAIFREDIVVGHVPRNLAPRLFHFLRRDVCKAFAVVT